MINAAEDSKSHTAALLLAIFLGGFGLHRFYLGHVGTGILRVLCLPLVLIPVVGWILPVAWHLADIMLVATKALRPKSGAYA